MAEDLSWNEFHWGIDSLKLKGTEGEGSVITISPILNFLFRPSKGPKINPAAIQQNLKNLQNTATENNNQSQPAEQTPAKAEPEPSQ